MGKKKPRTSRGVRGATLRLAVYPVRNGRLFRRRSVELFFFSRTGQRGDRRRAALNHGGHVVEVAGAHFLLVSYEGVTLGGVSEFLLLQLHIGGHVVAGVVVRQVEHAVPHVVDAGQGNELVLVAHGGQFALELGDGRVVQVLLPVEGRRAVVGQQLVRVFLLDGLGEAAGFVQVRLGGFTPDQVGVRRVGQAAGDGLVEAGADFVEAFLGTLAGHERLVVRIAVRGQQVGGVGVSTGQDDGRRTGHVGGQAGSGQLLHGFLGRNQYLAAHVAAFLHGSQLVFEVHAGGARFDHALHQLVGVQDATETGFGVGHDWCEVVDVAFIARVLAGFPLDLVGATERVVDALDHGWHGVHRVQRLVGVHGFGGVVVRGHLPARQVDRLDPGLDLLHGLAAGQGAHAVDEIFIRTEGRLGALGHQVPQFLGAHAGQGVLRLNRATQADHVSGGVSACHAFPARVFSPVFFKGCNLLFACQCHGDKPRRIGLGWRIPAPSEYAYLERRKRLLADQKLRRSSRIRRGWRRDERWARGEVSEARASRRAHGGIVGLYADFGGLAVLPITLPSLGTTSFQSQPRQTRLVGGTDTNRLRWVG